MRLYAGPRRSPGAEMALGIGQKLFATLPLMPRALSWGSRQKTRTNQARALRHPQRRPWVKSGKFTLGADQRLIFVVLAANHATPMREEANRRAKGSSAPSRQPRIFANPPVS